MPFIRETCEKERKLRLDFTQTICFSFNHIVMRYFHLYSDILVLFNDSLLKNSSDAMEKINKT